jgi:hypothetical protein
MLGALSSPHTASVAQMDRVSVSEAEGRAFESRRARQPFKNLASRDVALVFRLWRLAARWAATPVAPRCAMPAPCNGQVWGDGNIGVGSPIK